MTRQHAPCGTYAASRRHYRLGEPLDDACAQAQRDYQNELRDRDPEYAERGRVRLARRNRAIRRLIELHAAEFAILEEDERLREEGES